MAKGIDTEATTKEEIDDYITFKITEYTYYDVQDEELQEVFQGDFKGFSLSVFKERSQLGTRKLRTLLRLNGVQVRKDRCKTVAESLYNTLQEEDLTKWTTQEIEEHISTARRFNSAQINYLLSQNNEDTASSTHARTTVPDPPHPPDPLDPSDFPDPYQYQYQRTRSVSKEPVQLASREQSFGRDLAQTWQRCTQMRADTAVRTTTLTINQSFSMIFAAEPMYQIVLKLIQRYYEVQHLITITQVSRELSRRTTSPLIKSAT